MIWGFREQSVPMETIHDSWQNAADIPVVVLSNTDQDTSKLPKTSKVLPVPLDFLALAKAVTMKEKK